MSTGIGGKYIYDEKQKKVIKVSDDTSTPRDAGLGGPVWCPEGGYFDKALQVHFKDKEEKRSYMREHGLAMAGSEDKKVRGPEAGLGKRLYFYNS
jgi:hypothetical protein